MQNSKEKLIVGEKPDSSIMLLETWLTILVFGSAILSSFYFLYKSIVDSSAMYFVYWFGLTALSVSRFLYFFKDRIVNYQFISDYVAIVGLCFVLVGLFILIRDSKPSFARFPSVFTLLPVLVIPFFPLLSDKSVLRDLINIILQGGGLVVAILMVFINQVKRTNYGYLVGGVTLLIASYILKWIFELEDDYSWIWQVLLSMGIIVSSYGFQKLTQSNKTETIT